MFGEVFSLRAINPNFLNIPIRYYYILFILLHKTDNTDNTDNTTLCTFYPRPAATTVITTAIALLFTSPMLGGCG